MFSRLSRLPAAALITLALATTAACTGSSAPDGDTGGTAGATATGAPTPLVVTPGPPPPPGATGAPSIAISSLPPVPVGESATFKGGLVAKVASIDPIDLTANGPGEIAGPGVAVNVELSNDSADPVDLGGVVVNAYSGGGTPASANSSAPAAPATGSLPPGESRKGVYVFQVSREDATSLVVEINWNGSPDVVLIRR